MTTHRDGALGLHGKKRVTRLLALALAATSAMAGVTASGSTASAVTVSTVTAYPVISTDTYESKVKYWVNRKRAAHGLTKVRLASCPDVAAENWDSYLASTGEFYHQSMQDMLDRCNATWAGETLGRGGITPRKLVRLWMGSDSHRAVLLSTRARRIGVGSQPDSQGRWVTTADFIHF